MYGALDIELGLASEKGATRSERELQASPQRWYDLGFDPETAGDVVPVEYYMIGTDELLAYWMGRQDAATGQPRRNLS